MSDLIRREDVLKAIWDWCCNREYAYTNATYWLQKRIESIPSAERKGEWVYCEDYVGVGQDGYKCSECEFFIPWCYDYHADSDYISNYYFCPHCGARMKGADDGSC